MVLNLADPGYFRMVVEDFGRNEMNFTREQHAHDKGAHPIFVPIIPHGSQFDRQAVSRFSPKLPAMLTQAL